MPIKKAICLITALCVLFCCCFYTFAEYAPGSVKDELNDELSFVKPTNTSSFIKTRLSNDERFVKTDYADIMCSESKIQIGKEVVLKADSKYSDYVFSHWETNDGSIISTEATLPYRFSAGEKINAIYQTNLIWDIDFEDNRITVPSERTESMKIISDSGNKVMQYAPTSAWAITWFTYLGNDENNVYKMTELESNTDYVLTFDYCIKDVGKNANDILGIAPHNDFIKQTTPIIRLAATDENMNRWTTYSPFYFRTDDNTGNGYSNISEGLFQICSGKEFKVYVDNIKIKKVSITDDTPFENEETIGNYPTYENLLKLPYGTTAAELRMSFKSPESVCVAKSEKEAELSDTVKNKMTVKSGDYEKHLIIDGDLNADDAVNVTDIVTGIDTVIKGDTDKASVFAGDKNNDGKLGVSDIVLLRYQILSNTDKKPFSTDNDTAYSIAKYKNFIEINGRYKTYMTGITFNYGGMSIVFSAYCKGSVKVQLLSGATNSKFSVYVDGVKTNTLAMQDENNRLVLTDNLDEGFHSFRVALQDETSINAVNLGSIELCGKLLPKKTEKKMLFEFIGDSITAGCGALYPEYGANAAADTYAYKTAEAFGARYSSFAVGGRTLCPVEGRESIAQLYTYVRPWYGRTRNTSTYNTELYDFGEKADVIVVNLGTNDRTAGVSEQVYAENMRSFLQTLKEKNPKAKIVWCYGMMYTGDLDYSETITEIIDEFGGTENGYYSCSLPYDRGGVYSYTDKDGQTHSVPSVSEKPHYYYHPNIEGHTAAAEVLTKFLKENVVK